MLHYLKIWTCLSLFAVQANCTSGKAAAVVPPGVETFEIRGRLTYRERMALPPQSIAVVELRDVSIAGAPSVVGEQRIELSGRQVPVPFRLIVDRSRLAGGRRYAVHGEIIGPNRQLLWSTAAALPLGPVDPPAASADVGDVVMSRASPQGPPGTVGGSAVTAPAFTATGNEPGWKLEINDREIILTTDYGNRRVVAPFSAPQITGDTAKYISAVEGRTLIATIVERTCADTMTGMPYPRTVTVLFGDQEFRGCGGSPAGLLQGVEWTVENLNGRAIAGSSRGTLIFAPDGVLSGRSFCNSYRGRYALTGEGLTISLGASTLMGCPPEIMDQEKLFTDLLAAVRRFEAGAGGALILHTGDGRYIRLRRQ